MKYFFHDIESNKRLKLEIEDGVTCKKIKQILEEKNNKIESKIKLNLFFLIFFSNKNNKK